MSTMLKTSSCTSQSCYFNKNESLEGRYQVDHEVEYANRSISPLFPDAQKYSRLLRVCRAIWV